MIGLYNSRVREMWEDLAVKGRNSLKISRQHKGTEGPNCGVRGSRNSLNFCMSCFVYVEDGLRWRDFMSV